MSRLVQFHDPLTGAFSRSCFEARFDEEIDRAVRYGSSFSILIIDLDHFKSINDAYGHTRGDAILKEFVKRIQNIVRKSDLLFRFGGDEFILLLPNSKKEHAFNFANRLIEMIQSSPFSGEPPVAISASIGLAVFPLDGGNRTALFDRADTRLLEAKRRGRRMTVADDPPDSIILPFDDLSRLVERESAIAVLLKFIANVMNSKTGTLRVTGVNGSGKTRFLKEVHKIAKVRGFKNIQIQGHSRSKMKPYGALLDALPEAGESADSKLSAGTFFEEFERDFDEDKHILFVITVDDIHLLDSASVDVLNQLLRKPLFKRIAFVFTTDMAASPRIQSGDESTLDTIELHPLTVHGLSIWLRSLLHWEAPEEFTNWLHGKTGGLPGLVEKMILYLVRRGVMKRDRPGSWTFESNYTDVQFEKWPSEPKRAANLPSDLTNFIGRTEEIHKIKQIMETNRLITLVGPGGIGKTRLAIQVASNIPAFQDGIFFVPLASLTSYEFIIPAIADALNLPFQGIGTPELQLIENLKEKQLLLLLDNFDHLIPGAGFLTNLLKNCPSVHILCTSRERLKITGEMSFPVKSLETPSEEIDFLPQNYTSLQLFHQCALHADTEFQITEENKRWISRICNLVSGLPLGIELAAAWVPMLSCEEIAKEIEKNISFLETTLCDVPDRHKSLQGVFDYSWNLMAENDRKTLVKLSIFRGGFSRDAASKVAGASLQSMNSLMDKSFLKRRTSEFYFILEVLRVFAEEKLRGNPEQHGLLQRIHSEYYADFIKKNYDLLHKVDKNKYLSVITEVIENIRVGWIEAASRGDCSVLEKYIRGLDFYYERRALSHEGKYLFNLAVDRLIKSADRDSVQFKETLGSLKTRIGIFCFLISQYDEAESALTSASDIFRKLKFEKKQAVAENMLGAIAFRRGDYPKAKVLYERCLATQRKLGSKYGVFASLNNLAGIALSTGETNAAKELYEESLDLARQENNVRAIGAIATNLGLIYKSLGDIQKARRIIQESYNVNKENDDSFQMALSVDKLAEFEEFDGHYDKAEQMHKDNLAARRRIGDTVGIAFSKMCIADILEIKGDYSEAARLYQESLTTYQQLGHRKGVVSVLTCLSMKAHRENNLPQMKTLIDESLKISSEIGYKGGEVGCFIARGYYQFKQDRIPEAKQTFLHAIRLARKINIESSLIDSIKGYATILAEGDDKKTAYQLLFSLTQHAALSHHDSQEIQKIMTALQQEISLDVIRQIKDENQSLRSLIS